MAINCVAFSHSTKAKKKEFNMKIVLSLILAMIFAILISAQTNTTPIGVTPIVEPLPKFTFTKEEQDTLAELLLTELVSGVCGYAPSDPRCPDNQQKTADVYLKISHSPKLISYLTSKAIGDFEGIRRQSKSAMQVSQVADEHNVVMMRIIVAQNQRVIELLEALLKKK